MPDAPTPTIAATATTIRTTSPALTLLSSVRGACGGKAVGVGGAGGDALDSVGDGTPVGVGVGSGWLKPMSDRLASESNDSADRHGVPAAWGASIAQSSAAGAAASEIAWETTVSSSPPEVAEACSSGTETSTIREASPLGGGLTTTSWNASRVDAPWGSDAVTTMVVSPACRGVMVKELPSTTAATMAVDGSAA